MTGAVRVLHHGEGLELVLEPALAGVSALSSSVLRANVMRAIETAAQDVRWILLRSASAKALNGPDLPSPEDKAFPDFNDLATAIDRLPIPFGVLAEGPVSGRAADLYLAAHLRLAVPAAKFAFPSLASGRLPGSGATLRLARSIGAEQALRLFRSGQRVKAAEALALGLVDHVCDGESPEQTLATARAAMEALAGPRPSLDRDSGLRDGRSFLRAVATARQSVKGSQLLVDHALIDCVEAALLLPPAQAMDFVAEREAEVEKAPEAAALAHILRAEAAAAQLPKAFEAAEADPVRVVGIAGAEPGFLGLAYAALSRGMAVTVADPTRERLVAFLEKLAARQEAAVQANQMTAAQRDADWARLSPVLDFAQLGAADLILAATALPEVPDHPKRPLLMTGRGELSPKAMRLVLTGRVAELGLSGNSAPGPAKTAWAFLRRMGLTVVITGQQAKSGIAGRLSGAGASAIRSMVELGVDPVAIRSALTDFGQYISPISPIEGLVPRPMTSKEIVNRWLAALANESIRLLQAGVTRHAGDIDLVAVAGLGFPRLRGGPLHQSDQRGFMILRRDLTEWAKEGAVWSPVPGIDALVSQGRGFAGAVTPE